MVEKHSAESTGTYEPSTIAASENSFSKAARKRRPCSESFASIRLRKERWQTGAGIPSRLSWSLSRAPVWGAYGRVLKVFRSGTSRTSPTGPMFAMGWS